MLENKSLLVILAAICQLWHVNCDSGDKSSLVFVIDDTGSMMGDIDQVKTQVDSIFESAYTSNTSNTEDFVIVTFNDPGSKHRTTTKDKDVFKKALANITVDGGGDCPELAMEGLELALQNSRNGSLVYLFTDADAKDFDKYEAVKTLAKQKNCRLHFLLTGTCGYFNPDSNKKGNNEPGHRVFFDLAEATGGQVFSLFKEEVGAILGHASASISGGYRTVVASDVIPGSEDIEVPDASGFGAERYGGGAAAVSYSAALPALYRPDAISSADFAPGQPQADIILESTPAIPTTIRPGVALKPYHFNVTEGVKELLVSVSGFNPKVELTGPDGTSPKTEEVATTSGSKVIKILEAKPGQYTAKITSLGRTSIVISGNESGASKSTAEGGTKTVT